MILTIHHQVITRISRFSVNHDKHHTWSLHINNIQKEDKGYYMCQINTDPMLKQIGYVNVVGTSMVPLNAVMFWDRVYTFTSAARTKTGRGKKSTRYVLSVTLNGTTFNASQTIIFCSSSSSI